MKTVALIIGMALGLGVNYSLMCLADYVISKVAPTPKSIEIPNIEPHKKQKKEAPQDDKSCDCNKKCDCCCEKCECNKRCDCVTIKVCKCCKCHCKPLKKPIVPEYKPNHYLNKENEWKYFGPRPKTIGSCNLNNGCDFSKGVWVVGPKSQYMD